MTTLAIPSIASRYATSRNKLSVAYWYRSQHWNGRYFEKITLQDLGLAIQVGHPPGERCSSPAIGPRACMVIHTNGFHPITLLFCQCDRISRAGDRVQQLLRAELYPASLTDPTTFCTITALEHFHRLTLQSKITAYDYYMTLQAATDVTGIEKQYVSAPNCYDTTILQSQQYYRIASSPFFVLCANGDISKCSNALDVVISPTVLRTLALASCACGALHVHGLASTYLTIGARFPMIYGASGYFLAVCLLISK